MYEYEHFDGYDTVTFDIIETKRSKMTIVVAVTYIGKITVTDYTLYEDEDGLYFEYGPLFNKIYLENFEVM